MHEPGLLRIYRLLIIQTQSFWGVRLPDKSLTLLYLCWVTQIEAVVHICMEKVQYEVLLMKIHTEDCARF